MPNAVDKIKHDDASPRAGDPDHLRLCRCGKKV